MKLFAIFHIACLSLGLSVLPLFGHAQKPVKKTVKYTVQMGETVLGIAHRHKTTLDHLLSLNPGLQPDYVQSGQVINVPFVPGGAEPAPTMAQRVAAQKAAAEVAKQKAEQPAVAYKEVEVKPQISQPKLTYKEYKVKKKDTAYSLAKANNITVDELMAANPEMKQEGYQLKKGVILRIPVKKVVKAPQYAGLTSIRVAVILPLVGNNVENERSVEFYRGLLMGINEMKQKGMHFDVSAYNEPAPEHSVAQIMAEATALKPDVIIGPLYPSHFTDVTAVSNKQTKVVVPFSSKVPQVDYRPEVFVVNTPAQYEKSLAVDLFMKNFKKQTQLILLHSASGNKRSFVEELQQRASSAGYAITSLAQSSTAQQVSLALSGKKKGAFILVPDDDNAETMKRMLATISTLQQSLPEAQFSLLGYDAWLRQADSQEKLKMHSVDTYVMTSNFYYPYTVAAKNFQEQYTQSFQAPLVDCNPRMAPLGYDLARGFFGGLATYGRDFNTQNPVEGSIAAQPMLQTEPRFITVGTGGGYVCRSMWLIHFKKDMSIVKISAQ